MTFNITSIDRLENSVSSLEVSNQRIASCASSLEFVLRKIKTNWENEAGTDLASIISELEECVNSITGDINPTLKNYAVTMHNLVAEARRLQSKSLR